MRKPLIFAASALLAPAVVFAAASHDVPAFKYHGFQGEGPGYVPHFDERGSALEPSSRQLQLAQNLGATVRFGPNGTPKVVSKLNGFLSGAIAGDADTAARSWLKSNAELFGLDAAVIDSMETLRVSPLYESPDFKRVAQNLEPLDKNPPHVVLLRQTAEGLPFAGREGLVTVAMDPQNRVAFVGSSLAKDLRVTNSRSLADISALRTGAESVSLQLGQLELIPDALGDFITFGSSLLSDVQRVRPRILPTAEGLRHVWEVTLLDSAHSDQRGHPQAFILHVDAQTAKIWTRDNAVQHYVGNPAWKVFPNVPNDVRNPNQVPGEDTRELYCWNVAEGEEDPIEDSEGLSPENCEGFELREFLNRAPWDETHLGVPTFTTHGNNASTAISQVNFIAPDVPIQRPVSLTRTYDFTWTNAWFESACNPLSFVNPAANFADFEAATANLFAMHNIVHDWSYLLGFTEVNSNLQLHNFGNTSILRANDPEIGSSQAGRLTVNGRDNANQLTLQDGIPGITNQYLWQALPGAIYPAACVDGAFDMAIIIHEYTHAISNRMTGGPDGPLGGGQGGNMGEAWSDLTAIEYLQAFDLTPVSNESPFAMSVYVTGDPEAGIRNYAIDKSPLNFTSFQYDPNGLGSPHADSEIWGAVNYEVRQALIDKYQAQFPFEDKKVQKQCGMGIRSSHACPGNRRWVQMLFDGLVIQPANPGMLDARDAMLASDMIRYGGENQFEMWDAFARRGMGENAFSAGTGDVDPRGDFSSPLRDDEAKITFATQANDGTSPIATIYVGRYEARITPIGDTDPNGGFAGFHNFVPGTYEFFVKADGYGLTRFKETFAAGEDRTLSFTLRKNVASVHQGAVASGVADTPEDLVELIDDTETTNWQSTDAALAAGKSEGAFVEGRAVTVALAERTLVTDINVSAFLTPEGQNRFTALRSFDIAACDAAKADCSTDAGFEVVYQSPDEAFHAPFLRPKAPKLQLKNFDIPDVEATHMRIITRDSQCTGEPNYQREANPSGDPLNDADCDTGSNLQLDALAAFAVSNRPNEVRIAEFQVFGLPLTGAESRDSGAEVPSRGLSLRGGSINWLLLSLLVLPLALRRKRWI